MARCRIECADHVIEITVNDSRHVDDWNLSEAILKAIKGFDAACPSVTGVSSLSKRVAEGLKEK